MQEKGVELYFSHTHIHRTTGDNDNDKLYRGRKCMKIITMRMVKEVALKTTHQTLKKQNQCK